MSYPYLFNSEVPATISGAILDAPFSVVPFSAGLDFVIVDPDIITAVTPLFTARPSLSTVFVARPAMTGNTPIFTR